MKQQLRRTTAFAACLLALVSASAALSQAALADPKAMTRTEYAEHFEHDSVDRTYKLHYMHAPAEQNEVLTALRNVLDPMTKIFLVPADSIIVVHAPQETQAQITALIAKLDLPRPRFRLTYTVTELDGSTRIGVQHFSMVVVSGQRTQLKQGSRIPLLASGKPGENPVVTTYIDVGMNFDAAVDEIEGGASLRTKVEQTSVAPDSTNSVGANPVIRQTSVEGFANLTLGKPLVLGSLDVPSSTHHFDIEVVLQPVS